MITSDVFFDERNRTTERERKRVKKGEIFCFRTFDDEDVFSP